MEGCRHIKLADHFGEQLETPCGRCSGCRGDTRPLPAASDHTVPETLADALDPLLHEEGDLFDSPRVLSRFLCGISSPKLSRARLGSHRLFGALAETPFAQVMAWAERRLAREPDERAEIVDADAGLRFSNRL
jgi:ATP-dependent DNA helicase RecQ